MCASGEQLLLFTLTTSRIVTHNVGLIPYSAYTADIIRTVMYNHVGRVTRRRSDVRRKLEQCYRFRGRQDFVLDVLIFSYLKSIGHK